MTLRMPNGSLRLVFLGALCVVLATAMYSQLVFELPREPSIESNLASLGHVKVEQALTRTKVPIAEFADVTAKPLFSRTRRPPDPAVVANPRPVVVPVPPPPPPVVLGDRLTLIGIVITPQERTALFKPKSGGTVIELSEGKDIQGWLLSQIRNDRVVFQFEQHRQEIEFPPAKPPDGQRTRGERAAVSAPSRPRR